MPGPKDRGKRQKFYFSHVSDSDRVRLHALDPGGENFSYGGVPAVFPRCSRNFLTPGEGRKESPRACAPGASARASTAYRRNRSRKRSRFCCISASVLRLWHEWHRLCRLPGSVNTAQLPLWSRMWSTSVALVRIPCRAHSRQNGSRKSCALRIRRQASVPYIQRQDCASSLRWLRCCARCSSQ